MKDTNKPTGAQSLDGVEPVSETTDRVKRVEKPEPPVAEDPSPESLNPYSPEELWIDLNKVHAAGAVKRRLTTIPIRPPNKHEFFRTRRGDEYWKPVALIELERVLYLVHPAMVPHLDPEDFFYAFLCLAISKSGELFFWPLKISNKGRTNMWNESALEIAKKATENWVKKRSRHEDGKGSGYYDAEIPTAQFDDPVWPAKGLKELYDIAFKGDRIVDRMDHLVVQKLFGQIK
jgi:hypothetical protein